MIGILLILCYRFFGLRKRMIGEHLMKDGRAKWGCDG
jgi:hypothetical protein